MLTSPEIYAHDCFCLRDLIEVPGDVFTPLRRRLNSLKGKENIFASQLLVPILDVETMQNFFGWYFNNLSLEARDELVTDRYAYVPNVNGPFTAVSDFQQESQTVRKGDIRDSNEHILKKSEYGVGRSFIRTQMPEMPQAMAIIQYGLKTYLRTLSAKSNNSRTFPMFLRAPSFGKIELEMALKKLDAGLSSNGMMEEFLPILAHESAKAMEKGKAIEEGLHLGLRRSFTPMSAFESKTFLTGPSGAREMHTKCPFRGSIGQLMNTSFVKAPDGTYQQCNKPVPAGLLMFTMDYLREGKPLEPAPAEVFKL